MTITSLPDIPQTELSDLEIMINNRKKINEVTVKVNTLSEQTVSKEDLSERMKLSPDGDFTGTINGAPIVQSEIGLSSEIVQARDGESSLSERLNRIETVKIDNVNPVLIAPFFRSNDDTSVDLYLSGDGKRFKRISESPLFTARDTSIIYHDGYFYCAYTSYNPHDFTVKRSKNLRVWEQFNLSAGLFNAVTCPRLWAPEWFKDDNGKIYIILSANTKTDIVDIGGSTIPSFREYLIEVSLDNMQVLSSRELTLEDSNKIDGSMIKSGGIYNLFVKDEYDKKIEKWTSPDLITWTKQTDEINVFDGAWVEGPSIALHNGVYYLYADKYATYGSVFVSTSTDLINFTPAVPINTRQLVRHGTVLPLTDKGAKAILSEFMTSNNPIENNVTRTVSLANFYDGTKHVATLEPREGYLYYAVAGDGDVVIDSIVNTYGIKRFYVAMRSGSTGSIKIMPGDDLEIPTLGLTLSPRYGTGDSLVEFIWIEDLGVFKTKVAFDLQAKIGDIFKNLNTLGASGTIFDMFKPEHNAVYTVGGSDVFTISGIDASVPDGTEFYVGVFTSASGKLTITTGTGLFMPDGSYEISVATNRENCLIHLVKFSGTFKIVM